MYLHLPLGPTLCHPHCSHTTFQTDNNSLVCIYVFSTRTKANSFIFTFLFVCLFFPRRSPEEGNGSPLQYSYLENFMDRGAWLATVYGVKKSRTWLSNYYTFRSWKYFGIISTSFLKIPWLWYNWHTENI